MALLRPAGIGGGAGGAATRRQWRGALAVAILVVLVADASVVASYAASRTPPSDAARRFLDRYVADDGRVVRHDQGGDTVSEGQAYALLVAAGIGDSRRFARVWGWTQVHLQRPDGLFSWRWAHGRVVDAEPAADADLDMARALLVAADRFGEPGYAAEAQLVAAAVREKETEVVAGVRLLLPGPWAARKRPLPVNPGYLAPATFAMFGWDDMAGSARRVTSTGKAPRDWILVGGDGTVRPDGRYGYEAVRVPLRLAESPDPADRERAASMWPALRDHPFTGRHPAAMAGAAAAGAAAGELGAARRLLDRAGREDGRRPTYYGGALVALANLWLDLKNRA